MKWKDVIDYEGLYIVSDTGLVKSVPRKVKRGNSLCSVKGGLLHQQTDTNGRKSVGIYKNNTRKTIRVHTLVISSFIGIRNNNQETRHLDGNSSNNNLSNLAYGTHKENMCDMVRHGKSQRCASWNTKLSIKDVLDIRKIDIKNTCEKRKTAAKYKVHIATVNRIINRKRWTWL